MSKRAATVKPAGKVPSRAKGARAARTVRKELKDLKNVGAATLGDFAVLGIRSVAQLARRDPFRLYRALCTKTGQRHDPCVIDVFMATVWEAKGNRPKDWWAFTPERKALLQRRTRDISAHP